MNPSDVALLSVAVGVGILLASIAIVLIGAKQLSLFVRSHVDDAVKKALAPQEQASLEAAEYAAFTKRIAEYGKHPRADAAKRAYEARFPAKTVIVPDDYREATDAERDAAVDAQQAYHMAKQRLAEAHRKLASEKHAQGDHSECDTSCSVVLMDRHETAERTIAIGDELVDPQRLDDQTLAEMAEKVEAEMRRRREEKKPEVTL